MSFTAAGGDGDLTNRVRGYLPDLSGASRAIAHYILDDPASVTAGSISDLADAVGTSPASVTRFCRAVGLSGYAQLRLEAAAELGRSAAGAWTRDQGAEIRLDDTPQRAAAVIAEANMQSIGSTAGHLDHGLVAEVAAAIATARRTDVFAVGGSTLAAQELQLRLHRIGRPIWWFPDTHQAKMSVCQLRPGDVFLGISRSGRTREVLDVLDEAAARGATTVALTSFPASPLAQRADMSLTTTVQDVQVRHGSLAAKYAQLFVVDCIYSVVAQLTFSEATTALATTTRALASHRATQPGRRDTNPPESIPADGA